MNACLLACPFSLIPIFVSARARVCVCVCVCETWSVTLREEHMLKEGVLEQSLRGTSNRRLEDVE